MTFGLSGSSLAPGCCTCRQSVKTKQKVFIDQEQSAKAKKSVYRPRPVCRGTNEHKIRLKGSFKKKVVMGGCKNHSKDYLDRSQKLPGSIGLTQVQPSTI